MFSSIWFYIYFKLKCIKNTQFRDTLRQLFDEAKLLMIPKISKQHDIYIIRELYTIECHNYIR